MKLLKLAQAAPVLLWGPPGVGKSAAVVSAAQAEGLPVEVVIASIREPQDFIGLPVVNGRIADDVHVSGSDCLVSYAPPGWAKRLAEAGGGVLFLDEITTAPPAVQAALLRVVLNRVVGDLRLPENTLIIAAANPPEIAAGGWDLSPPLANRFIHLTWKVDPEDWANRFPAYWGNPPQLPGINPQTWERARSLVATFIRRRPELLLQLPRQADAQGRAWPSPRTWDFASRVLALCNLDPLAAAEGIAGAVGEGPGMEFVNWAREQDLPDPEELLRKPEKFRLSGRGDRDFAVLSSIAAATCREVTKERWNAAWKIFAKAAQDGAADVAAAAVREVAALRRKHPELPLPKEEVRAFLPLLQGGVE